MEVDNGKLVSILHENKVKMNNGNVCLYDFVQNVIGSKNPKLYIRNLNNYDKHLVNGNSFISTDDCVKILEKTKFKKCKRIYARIHIVTEEGVSIIDVNKRIFQFEGHRFMAFFVLKTDIDWDVWLKGAEIAGYLLYGDKDKAIREHVDEDNKMIFSELVETFKLDISAESKTMNKNAFWINLSGFFNLIRGSNKPLAKRIKKWVDNEVLPALTKYGAYSMQPKDLKINFFYDSSTFSEYDKVAVLYIGYIGFHGKEHLFKFGLSRDMFRRDYKEHRKRIGRFKVVFIGKCDNCEAVEELFKKELRLRNVDREKIILEHKQTELFTVTTNHGYQYFIDLMQQLINEHPLPAIREMNSKNAMLESKVASLEQRDEIVKLELQYKMSDNYKLELERDIKQVERDIRIKELELESKSVDIELQKEKNKYIAIKKGRDLTQLGLIEGRKIAPNKRPVLKL
jgi:prophage antirepressor-like protein/ribosomal protein L7/L12